MDIFIDVLVITILPNIKGIEILNPNIKLGLTIKFLT